MEHKSISRSIEENKRIILYTAAKLFLNKGYTATTLRLIAKEADVNIGSLMYTYESKENILCSLVSCVLEGQFSAAKALLKGLTEDPLLFWAAETVLQLYMAESSEHIRELYLAAYSLPKSAALIYQNIAEKMQHYFKPFYPNYEAKDFYELEIASGGIIRGFMSVPCDMYFTMERKVRRYLETSFLVYKVPEAKVQEAITFVSQIDFKAAAPQVVDSILITLDHQMQASFSADAPDN